jgi:hypothetical protein
MAINQLPRLYKCEDDCDRYVRNNNNKEQHASLNSLFQHLPEGTEKNYDNLTQAENRILDLPNIKTTSKKIY